MARFEADQNGAVISLTTLLPGAAPLPPPREHELDVDEATNAAVIAAFDTDSRSFRLSGGVLTRGGAPVAINPPAPAPSPAEPVPGPKGDPGPQGLPGPQGIPGPPGADWPASWEGVLHLAMGDGNPARALLALSNSAVSVAGPTPTGIGATVGRLVLFRCRAAITVRAVRWHSLTNVAGLYAPAIYRADTGARAWAPGAITTGAAGFQATATGLPITLDADTPYWFGLSTVGTGTTAGFRSLAAPIATSLGLPALPGSLNLVGAARYGQVALVAGAWPAQLPAVAAAAFAAGNTGSVPPFWLDSAP